MIFNRKLVYTGDFVVPATFNDLFTGTSEDIDAINTALAKLSDDIRCIRD